MNIADWTIRNKYTSLVALVCIVIYGGYTFVTIPMQEDPDFVLRTAIVTTTFAGASPQKVEELVTDKLEEHIREMVELDNVTSESRAGVSIIKVNIKESYTKMTPIWEKLRHKVDDAALELPDGAGTPEVNDEFGDVFGFLVTLTGDGYTYREMKDAMDDVRQRVLRVDGVVKAEIWGNQDERVYIEMSDARLADLGMTPFALAQIIQAQNTVRASGKLLDGPELWRIRSTGEFDSVDDIRNLSLRLPGATKSVALSDLASVKRGFADPPADMVRYNGEPCLMLAVSMGVGHNIINVGKKIDATLSKAQTALPLGLDLNYVIYTPDYVRDSIYSFLFNLLESFAFVIIVLLLFVGIRTGIICGTLVPMAMIACLAMLPWFDQFLQRISIASMIVALGILVDNGVVVSENILVRMTQGEDRLSAVKAATAELAMPLMAASLTTIFAFLPIPMAPNAVGEYCVSLFIVVALTLGSSWVLSMTMVPMMCYALIRPEGRKLNFHNPAYRFYHRLLLASLHHKWLTLVIIFGACGVSLWGFRFISVQFMPPNERAQFLIDFRQPYGTDIRTTAERVAGLEKFLLADPAFQSMITFIGSGGPRWYLPLDLEQPSDNFATLVVNIKDFDQLDGILQRTNAELAAHYPDARYRVKRLMMGPPAGAAVQVRISGDNMDDLYRMRDKVEEIILNTKGATDPWDDWGAWSKQMVIDVDQNKARYAGLTSEDIALSLQMQLSSLQISDYREGTDVIPIVMRSDAATRNNPKKVTGLHVYSYSSNYSAPLLQVADIKVEWQPSDIRRRDQRRTMTVKADAEGRLSSDILNDMLPHIDKLMASAEWPAGFTLEYGGENEKMDKAMIAVMDQVPLAVFLLSLVLVAQFNSVRKPLIVLLTLPPMIIGITPGMLLSGQNFSFMAFLGMISLLGIIVNNAIMLLDRVNIIERGGAPIGQALIRAGMQRARPILMTTITTILGLTPLILSGGGMWRPMAVLMVSGLSVATLLTLILCPALYAVLFRVDTRTLADEEE